MAEAIIDSGGKSGIENAKGRKAIVRSGNGHYFFRFVLMAFSFGWTGKNENLVPVLAKRKT